MDKELSGVKELPPRWRRCVHRVDADLGELLGQSYVKARFAGDSKARAVDLTKAVLGAMHGELDHLPWMDDATRGAAKTKLDKMALPRRLSRQLAHVRVRDHAHRLREERPRRGEVGAGAASSRRSASRSTATTGR